MPSKFSSLSSKVNGLTAVFPETVNWVSDTSRRGLRYGQPIAMHDKAKKVLTTPQANTEGQGFFQALSRAGRHARMLRSRHTPGGTEGRTAMTSVCTRPPVGRAAR